MLKFFRKIRKSLIGSNNTKKYLLYAIGEIALVVIGILIALQINNWNEERKSRILEIQALVNLKEEFQNNHKDLKDHITWKRDIQAQWSSFLDTISNQLTSFDEKIIKRPIASFIYYNISNSILNSLLVTGNIDNLQNDSLKYLLTTWEDEVKDYDQFQVLHSDFVSNHFFSFERNLFPNENNKRFGYEYPFQGKIDKIKLYKDAYNSMEYHNMLLHNFYWINIQLSRINRLEDKMEKIIELLNDEIMLSDHK